MNKISRKCPVLLDNRAFFYYNKMHKNSKQYKGKYFFKMAKVFIDGSAGTTGLRIHERLKSRQDIELITLSEEYRKDTNARKEALNSADIAFLCLPDDAARQAINLIENSNTAVIDTSTAHRTLEDWAYGFAELKGQFEKIKASKRIANPGCHATGVISLLAPLTKNGVIGNDSLLSVFSLTGYSGGGKKMIAEYEAEGRSVLYDAPRMYGLSQTHKHIPEIVKVCGLEKAPVFCPVVAPYYSGMQVTIGLDASQLNCDINAVKEIYKQYYTDGLVSFCEDADENGFLAANALSGKDNLQIAVFGNSERILLVSRFDNLGKGASGAAIQNMNILLGCDEATGLEV